MLRLPAGRQLFDAASLGRPRRAVARRAASPSSTRSATASRRRSPARRASQASSIAMRCLEGRPAGAKCLPQTRPAPRRRLTPSVCRHRIRDAMNQHARIDPTRRSRSSMSAHSAAGSARAIDDADRARARRIASSSMGPEVAEFESAARGLLRRALRGLLRERHRRAGAGADGAGASARATR